MRFYCFKIVVFDLARRRWLQHTIESFRMRQRYHVLNGNWCRVVDVDIKLHVLRSELYGRGYCGS